MRDKHGDQYDDDDPIIESQARPVGEPMTCISTAELAALQARLAEAEAQRAVLVAALEHIRGAKWDHIEGQPMIVLGRTPSGLGTSLIAPAEVCRQALANQPPSDLVALVKAADDFVAALDAYSAVPSPDNGSDCDSAQAELEGAIDTLLQNQPGFRALIDGEDV